MFLTHKLILVKDMLRNIREYIDNSEFQLNLLKGRVNVLNYQELLQINSKEMIFTTSFCKINVKGNNLVLSKLLDSELLITGDIDAIEVINE